MTTATLIELVSEEGTTAPTAAELKDTYDVLDRLWDAIMAVEETGELSEANDTLASMERDAILAARAVVHRHMLVTLYPEQHIGHYRVHVNH